MVTTSVPHMFFWRHFFQGSRGKSKQIGCRNHLRYFRTDLAAVKANEDRIDARIRPFSVQPRTSYSPWNCFVCPPLFQLDLGVSFF